VNNKNNKTEHWLRSFLISILVAGLTAFLTYIIPKTLNRGKQLSYQLDGPITYFDTQEGNFNNISIEINNKPISSLHLYQIKIINSGDLPITQFFIRFVFSDIRNDIEIFSISHQTTPEFEFGVVSDQVLDDNSIRIYYKLMNPNDEDVVSILTDKPLPIEFFSKTEGVKIKQMQNNGLQNKPEVFLIISFLASLLALSFSEVMPKIKSLIK
jgi:hypothetical protein